MHLSLLYHNTTNLGQSCCSAAQGNIGGIITLTSPPSENTTQIILMITPPPPPPPPPKPKKKKKTQNKKKERIKKKYTHTHTHTHTRGAQGYPAAVLLLNL